LLLSPIYLGFVVVVVVVFFVVVIMELPLNIEIGASIQFSLSRNNKIRTLIFYFCYVYIVCTYCA
jgi:hypothetical protein